MLALLEQFDRRGTTEVNHDADYHRSDRNTGGIVTIFGCSSGLPSLGRPHESRASVGASFWARRSRSNVGRVGCLTDMGGPVLRPSFSQRSSGRAIDVPRRVHGVDVSLPNGRPHVQIR